MATSSSARDFDGNADYLATGGTTAYNITTGDMTIIAWIYPDSYNRDICGNLDASAGEGWEFWIGATTGPLTLSKSGVAAYTSTLTAPTSTWTGVAAAVDNGTNINFYKLTTTGTLTNQTVTAATNTISSTGDLTIGFVRAYATSGFDGAVSHVQFFNRLLSANEVRNALMSPGSVTNGLLGYWPIYGQLSPENDLSSSNYDGTVNGSGATKAVCCPAIPSQTILT